MKIVYLQCSLKECTEFLQCRPVGKGGSVGSDEPPSWEKGPHFYYSKLN